MSTLWIGIAVLTLIAIAFMFAPVVRHQRLARSEATERRQQNIDIFRERLAELENERRQGYAFSLVVEIEKKDQG